MINLHFLDRLRVKTPQASRAERAKSQMMEMILFPRPRLSLLLKKQGREGNEKLSPSSYLGIIKRAHDRRGYL